MKRALWITIILLWARAGFGAEPVHVATFQNAIAAYQQNDFGLAAEGFKHLIDAGLSSGALYYDLGNAYYRSGKTGQALAAYLLAMRYTPRDRDLQYNLDFVRRQTKDKIEPNQKNILLHAGLFWLEWLSAREWLWAAALASVVFWSALAFRLWRAEDRFKAATVSAGVVLVVALCGLANAMLSHGRRGVMIEPASTVYSGPGTMNTVLFRLHEGSEFVLRDREAGWLRLELADGKQGWVEARFTSLAAVESK